MKWHHSLYWRIAVGFVGCLALLLVVQGMLFVWVVARSGRTVPNQPPERLAQTIALDATRALERDPAVDLTQYIRQEYANDAQPFFVLLADGGVIDIGGGFQTAIVQDARARLEALKRLPPERLERGRFGSSRGAGTGNPAAQEPPLGGGSRADRSAPDGARPPDATNGMPPRGRPFMRVDPFVPLGAGRSGDRRPGYRPFRPAPIVANGRLAGLVVVPPQPPFTFLLARYAPVLGLVAAVTLIVGAMLATIVIFGPARKRLRAVEHAARRLGAGDLAARAPAAGRDEVAAVASAFNAMASDLSARAEALAASDRMRRQLLADVSHELNTPVTAMRGYIETLTMTELGLDEATRARYLSIIGDETARLERLIGDLLDLARLEGGGGSLAVEDVPVAQIFARVLARHERASSDAGVRLTTTIVPGAEIVHGDRDRLEQALQNLTANALRYAPAGTAIELAARSMDDGVALTLTDAGTGIAPEHLPHVFDRFYKVEESRAIRQGNGIAGGSGLGLSIVKAIVERHGGTVSVRSEPGHTTFELRIRNRASVPAS